MTVEDYVFTRRSRCVLHRLSEVHNARHADRPSKQNHTQGVHVHINRFPLTYIVNCKDIKCLLPQSSAMPSHWCHHMFPCSSEQEMGASFNHSSFNIVFRPVQLPKLSPVSDIMHCTAFVITRHHLVLMHSFVLLDIS